MEIDERVLAAKFEKLLTHLMSGDRCWAAARWLGHGGWSWARRRRGVAQDRVGGGG